MPRPIAPSHNLIAILVITLLSVLFTACAPNSNAPAGVTAGTPETLGTPETASTPETTGTAAPTPGDAALAPPDEPCVDPSAATTRLTRHQWLALKPGMTEAALVAVMGSPGEPATTVPEQATWANVNGQEIVLQFAPKAYDVFKAPVDASPDLTRTELTGDAIPPIPGLAAGMTMEEVVALLGQPTSTQPALYGLVWRDSHCGSVAVTLKDGLITLLDGGNLASIGEVPPIPESQRALTDAQLDAIRANITYDDVVDLLGFEGTETTAADLPGRTREPVAKDTRAYVWRDAAGRQTTATFTSGTYSGKEASWASGQH